MQLLRADELREEPGEAVFRERALGRAFLVAVVAAIACGWLALASLGGWWWLPALALGLPLLAVAGWMAPGVVRGFTLRHWVLRVREDGVALHLRSYLNDDPAGRGDAVVLWVPRAELASARERVERLRVLDSDGDEQTLARLALELELRAPAPAELEQALRRERTRWPRGGRHGVHLVSAPQERLLRVTWREPSARVVPEIGRALARLARLAPVRAPGAAEQPEPIPCDDAELDAYVCRLAADGQRIAAVRLLRRRRGLGLRQAREHVERLLAERSAA